MATGSANSVISITEVSRRARGRKAVVDEGLVNAMKGLGKNQALKVEQFGKAEDEASRSRISTTIRNHWKRAFGDSVKPSIAYTPDGTPQVFRRP